jgi:hypothetical protein
MVGISLILVSVPFVAAALDGVLDSFLSHGSGRPLLQAPVVILYILLVAPRMAKNDAHMLNAFRPLVLIDNDAFNRLVREASRIHPFGEVAAMLVGVLIGFGLSLPWLSFIETPWLRISIPVMQCLMFGLLIWTVYSSVSSTRVIKALHQQPLQIDILNIKPFEPMGRHSLVTSLVFVGGVTLAVIFGLNIESMLAWQSWISILPFLVIPVIIFFLSMGHTHRVLAREKRRALHEVGQRLNDASSLLRSRIALGEDLGNVAIEYTALLAYEARVKAAFTWPFNTAMLRTLSFSVILPFLVRALSILLFGR